MFRESQTTHWNIPNLGFIEPSPQVNNLGESKPFLKWAGGKGQLLSELKQYIPDNFGKYIEPFLGGGALFFALRPKSAILSDSNPELINCYRILRDHVNDLIDALKQFKNSSEEFYRIRSQKIDQLNELERAARFIYLNKTCFNGLYRVNKKGEFNVPYGKYTNPVICDEIRLRSSHKALQNAELICNDYKAVLRRHADKGDFLFLDPPYYPLGGHADFQRYTKDSFYEEDHIELRDEFNRVVNLGCNAILTNSNTDFVNNLYKGHQFSIVETKRLISSNANTRTGQDLIIVGKRPFDAKDELLKNFPGTRYMGSKYKILTFLWDSIKDLKFNSALDAFAGSGCVSYMLKEKGVEVHSNDFLAFSANIGKALIENYKLKLDKADIEILLQANPKAGNFISSTFKGIYFDTKDNKFLDNTRENIELLSSPEKKALALAALTRACMKKRARGIFTYVGHRYDDGRRDMQLSIKDHFIDNIEAFNNAVFNNGKLNKAYNEDVFNLDVKVDLVYFDPPYLTSKSDNDYTRRYHFVEGLIKRWDGLDIDHSTKTKKFKKYSTPFDSKKTVSHALDMLFSKYKESIIVVSYSSNSIPSKSEMCTLLKKYKNKVEIKEIDHQYSFGNQNYNGANSANKVKEFLFVAY